VRVDRALYGLDRPGLLQLMHRLGQLMHRLGQLMLVLGQPLLVLGQLMLVPGRERVPGRSRNSARGRTRDRHAKLLLGLGQLLLGPVELSGQSSCQRSGKLEILDGRGVRDPRYGRCPVCGRSARLTESNHYSSATAAAVERWQKALGLQATGEIPLGGVVFEPGPIRVTSVTRSVGTSAGAAWC
jgi:hypothetical protein